VFAIMKKSSVVSSGEPRVVSTCGEGDSCRINGRWELAVGFRSKFFSQTTKGKEERLRADRARKEKEVVRSGR